MKRLISALMAGAFALNTLYAIAADTSTEKKDEPTKEQTKKKKGGCG